MMLSKRDRKAMPPQARTSRGSVTVEATISLTAFLFAILTILSVLDVCRVQAKMSVAINNAAKELSKYSYLYSLTGLPESKLQLAKAAEESDEKIDSTLNDVNAVFSAIQDLSKTEISDAEDVSGKLGQLGETFSDIKGAGSNLEATVAEIAKDPKSTALGLAKLAASKGLDYAESKLIAGPLSKALCKKNLLLEEDADIEQTLCNMRIVPDAKGSYYGGLDFSESTIFAGGSNEIRVTVYYKVRLLSFLPVRITYTLHQTAVTHGWLAGSASYRTVKQELETVENSSIWIDGNPETRNSLIRKQGIAEYKDDGYMQVAGNSYQYAHVYHPGTDEFVGFFPMNPLYSEEGDRTMTIEDISEEAYIERIQVLCAGIRQEADNKTAIYRNDSGAKTTKEVTDATATVVLVIPMDTDLDKKMEEIVSKCDTKGVSVVIQPSYGNGARTRTVSGDEVTEDAENEGGE